MSLNKDDEEISLAYDKLGGIIWIILGLVIISIIFGFIYSNAIHKQDRILMATLATILLWPMTIYGIVLTIKNRKGEITKIIVKEYYSNIKTKPGRKKLLRRLSIFIAFVGISYIVFRGLIFFSPFFEDITPQIKAKVLYVDMNDYAVIAFNYDGKYYIRKYDCKKVANYSLYRT